MPGTNGLMQNYVASDLGLHCLTMFSLRDGRYKLAKGQILQQLTWVYTFSLHRMLGITGLNVRIYCTSLSNNHQC